MTSALLCHAQSGPDAEAYGANEHFPVGTVQTASEKKFMVGSFSHFDSLLPSVAVAPAAQSWQFSNATLSPRLLDAVKNYLAGFPATGLLIAQDNQILFEGYQYERTPSDLFTSQSMIKTLVGVLAGVALAPGAVADPVSKYVPALKGTPYGDVTLRNLLHMTSGVTCQWDDPSLEHDTLAAMQHTCRQEAAQGTRFRYSGADAQVLGFVVSAAGHASLARYLQDKIWQQIGTESKATWATDAAGREIAGCCFNATLRDYARVGRLLANDGNWDGKQLIPKQWLLDATTVAPSDSLLSPGQPAPFYGYGYQVWIFPGTRRMFSLVGSNGQRIFVDPKSKLVLVQTAVTEKEVDLAKDAETIHLWFALVRHYATE